MTENAIREEYFDWLYGLVCDDRYSRTSYRKLFSYLFEREFLFIVPMDENRWKDGVDLRYDFGRIFGYPDPTIASYLDIRPCSVLEMMIALAIRCENQIMENDEYGNRVGQWFWEMMVNLGLGHLTDNNYSESEAEDTIDIFLSRGYSRDGRGGLFTIHDSSKDMRQIDIWYQMCFYLNEMIGE